MRVETVGTVSEILSGVSAKTQVVTIQAFVQPTNADGTTRTVSDAELDLARGLFTTTLRNLGFEVDAVSGVASFAPVELRDGETLRVRSTTTQEKVVGEV